MNILNVRLLLVILLVATSCKKTGIQSSRQVTNWLPYPPISIFPDSTIYKNNPLSITGLQEDLDKLSRSWMDTSKATGLSSAILVPGKGSWSFQAGMLSKPEGRKVDQHSIFYWADVGKLVTATIIIRLTQDNKISLRDKVVKWFPQYPTLGNITIYHLINSIDGFYSYDKDPDFRNNIRYYSPDELINIAFSHPNGPIGEENWNYSNTGFLLLALIAEKVEKKPFDQIVQQRISIPLKLSSFKALQPKEKDGNLALGHMSNGSIASFDYTVSLGTGTIVSTAADMATFHSAFLTGKLISKSLAHSTIKARRTISNDGQYYGQGVMIYNFWPPNNATEQWIGHSGELEHYKVAVVMDIYSRIIVAVSVNQTFPVEKMVWAYINKVTAAFK